MYAKKQKHIIVGAVILLLLACSLSVFQGVNYMRATMPLRHFSKLIKQGRINDISLTIYYLNPVIFTLFPLSVEDLINWHEYQRAITGSELGEYADLFKQVNSVTLVPFWEKSTYLDARIYYVFKTDEEGVIFDVAMWGSDGGILVNGIEVRDDIIFYDIIIPFLPEDAAERLK